MTRPPTTSNDPAPTKRVVDYAVLLSWLLNAALLLSTYGWIYFDGRSSRTIELARQTFVVPLSSRPERSPVRQETAVTLVKAACLVSAVTLTIMFASLFVGGRRFRNLRGWLVFSALVGGWLGVAVGWPEIHWRGQARRVTTALPAIGSFAKLVDSNWPDQDGELPALGGFLTYSNRESAVILPLQKPQIPGTGLQISAIERTADGALRFELAGREMGTWVERRLDDGPPKPFVGGLETHYRIARQQEIAPRWFLVRYQPGHKDG